MGSTAVSVCSTGSGGAIESWDELDAWARRVERAAAPATLVVLGVLLELDRRLSDCMSEPALCWRASLAQHALLAVHHTHRDTWQISLVRLDGDLPGVHGAGATRAMAERRLLEMAHKHGASLGIEVVLSLAASVRLPAPPRAPDPDVTVRAAEMVAAHERSERETARPGGAR